MTLVIDRLLAIPARPRRLRVHRTVALSIHGTPAEDFVPNPTYAQPDSGRWATSAGTLYTAAEIPTTWREYCRWQAKNMRARPGWTRGIPANMRDHVASAGLGPPPPQRALVQLDFELRCVPDLTTADATQKLISAGFDTTKMRADDHSECQKLAAVAERLGWDALVVPSAASDGLELCVPVFHAGRERIVEQDIVVSPAGPTVLQAMHTRYREGERPSWLKLR